MNEFHAGDTWTYVGPRGSKHRLDYIVISEMCKNSIVQSWIEHDIELINGERDHSTAVLQMELVIGADNKGCLFASTFMTGTEQKL